MGHIAFLAEMEKLPIGLSPRVLHAAMSKFGSGQVDALIERLGELRKWAAQALISFIFDDGKDDAPQDAEVRTRTSMQIEETPCVERRQCPSRAVQRSTAWTARDASAGSASRRSISARASRHSSE